MDLRPLYADVAAWIQAAAVNSAYYLEPLKTSHSATELKAAVEGLLKPSVDVFADENFRRGNIGSRDMREYPGRMFVVCAALLAADSCRRDYCRSVQAAPSTVPQPAFDTALVLASAVAARALLWDADTFTRSSAGCNKPHAVNNDQKLTVDNVIEISSVLTRVYFWLLRRFRLEMSERDLANVPSFISDLLCSPTGPKGAAGAARVHYGGTLLLPPRDSLPDEIVRSWVCQGRESSTRRTTAKGVQKQHTRCIQDEAAAVINDTVVPAFLQVTADIAQIPAGTWAGLSEEKVTTAITAIVDILRVWLSIVLQVTGSCSVAQGSCSSSFGAELRAAIEAVNTIMGALCYGDLSQVTQPTEPRCIDLRDAALALTTVPRAHCHRILFHLCCHAVLHIDFTVVHVGLLHPLFGDGNGSSQAAVDSTGADRFIDQVAADMETVLSRGVITYIHGCQRSGKFISPFQASGEAPVGEGPMVHYITIGTAAVMQLLAKVAGALRILQTTTGSAGPAVSLLLRLFRAPTDPLEVALANLAHYCDSILGDVRICTYHHHRHPVVQHTQQAVDTTAVVGCILDDLLAVVGAARDSSDVRVTVALSRLRRAALTRSVQHCQRRWVEAVARQQQSAIRQQEAAQHAVEAAVQQLHSWDCDGLIRAGGVAIDDLPTALRADSTGITMGTASLLDVVASARGLAYHSLEHLVLRSFGNRAQESAAVVAAAELLVSYSNAVTVVRPGANECPIWVTEDGHNTSALRAPSPANDVMRSPHTTVANALAVTAAEQLSITRQSLLLGRGRAVCEDHENSAALTRLSQLVSTHASRCAESVRTLRNAIRKGSARKRARSCDGNGQDAADWGNFNGCVAVMRLYAYGFYDTVSMLTHDGDTTMHATDEQCSSCATQLQAVLEVFWFPTAGDEDYAVYRPDLSSTLALLGALNNRLGQFSEALVCYCRAIEVADQVRGKHALHAAVLFIAASHRYNPSLLVGSSVKSAEDGESGPTDAVLAAIGRVSLNVWVPLVSVLYQLQPASDWFASTVRDGLLQKYPELVFPFVGDCAAGAHDKTGPCRVPGNQTWGTIATGQAQRAIRVDAYRNPTYVPVLPHQVQVWGARSHCTVHSIIQSSSPGSTGSRTLLVLTVDGECITVTLQSSAECMGGAAGDVAAARGSHWLSVLPMLSTGRLLDAFRRGLQGTLRYAHHCRLHDAVFPGGVAVDVHWGNTQGVCKQSLASVLTGGANFDAEQQLDDALLRWYKDTTDQLDIAPKAAFCVAAVESRNAEVSFSPAKESDVAVNIGTSVASTLERLSTTLVELYTAKVRLGEQLTACLVLSAVSQYGRDGVQLSLVNDITDTTSTIATAAYHTCALSARSPSFVTTPASTMNAADRDYSRAVLSFRPVFQLCTEWEAVPRWSIGKSLTDFLLQHAGTTPSQPATEPLVGRLRYCATSLLARHKRRVRILDTIATFLAPCLPHQPTAVTRHWVRVGGDHACVADAIANATRSMLCFVGSNGEESSGCAWLLPPDCFAWL